MDNTIRDKELEQKIPNLKAAVRISGLIKFEDEIKPRISIIDTGAHISVLPLNIWKNLNVKILAEHEMKGILPDYKIPVKVGLVKAKLIDEYENETKEVEFLTYLAPTDKMPIILGFRGLLENFKLMVDVKQNEAYVE